MSTTTRHLQDEILERYAKNSLPEAEAETVEDHLALCSHCLDRLDETTAFVEGMHAALKNRPAEEPRKFQLPFWLQRGWATPMWAGAAFAAAGLFFAVNHMAISHPGALPAPAMVVLDGTRGTSSVVHGGGPFDFELFMPAEGKKFHVEFVDANGRKQWESDVNGNQGKLHAVVKQRVAEGQYFIEVTDSASGYKREFGVTVEK
jgi:hypothetical protein